MSRNGPEQQRQRRHTSRHKYRHPNSASDQKLLDVLLPNSKRPERRRLGLAEEDEDRVELVLVRDEEEDGEREGDKELRKRKFNCISNRRKNNDG